MIPFNKPKQAGNELSYLKEVLSSAHWAGDGPFTKRCQQFIENELAVKKALLTTSCTDALEMCALLLDLKSGDEIIMPAFTFVSTANAFYIHGGKPVFVDIRPDTLNIDENLIEKAITPKTKAIVVVHYAGIACDMDPILALARAYNLRVIEDNAHGIFGKYKGRPLGSIGDLATLSFHETKNISSGEGGALLVNDQTFFERAEILREKGTNRSRFFRGEIDKYTWVDKGSSFLPNEMTAAVLLAQLEGRISFQETRKAQWSAYNRELREWAGVCGASLPFLPEYASPSWHLFYILFDSLKKRELASAFLKERGIYAPFHYLPLHRSDIGRKLDGAVGQLPVTESVSDRLIRLPLSNSFGSDETSSVIRAVIQLGF